MSGSYTDPPLQLGRTQLRDIVAGAVKPEAFAPILVSTMASSTASTAAGTNMIVTTTFNAGDKAGFAVGLQNWSVFIGAITDPGSNLLPGGSAVNAGNYPMWGPIPLFFDVAGSGTPTDNSGTRERLQVLNASGGLKTITMQATFVYLINMPLSLTGAAA
jgi:hypothetical protein